MYPCAIHEKFISRKLERRSRSHMKIAKRNSIGQGDKDRHYEHSHVCIKDLILFG